jgi:hypothetical protein
MNRTSRLYVGRNRSNGRLEVFRALQTPTDESHGRVFAYAIGPFRTARAARLMADCGSNNPHLVSVAQAERLAARKPLS